MIPRKGDTPVADNKNQSTQQNKANLFSGHPEKEFFFWVNPKNYMTFHNIHITGHMCSNPIPETGTSAEDNLLFIPNPKYKGSITPYQNNIVKRIRAEYFLEFYRPKHYPARTHALFICNSKDEAVKYSEIHPDHTKGRVLIKGSPTGGNLFSIHDSGWFDFLCKDASIDEETAKQCSLAYWSGAMVSDCQLQLYGNPWTQPATMEVLFYGQIKISEEHKKEIHDLFKKAYQETPWEYPKMYL